VAFDRKPENYETGVDKIFYTLTMKPVSDNNLNKKFFTEADSPVPLLPPDMAWSNMEQKLDAEKKKKRGFFFWCFFFTGSAVLLMGAGALLWWQPHNQEIVLVKFDSNKLQDREREPIKNNGIVVNKSTQGTVNVTVATTGHTDLPKDERTDNEPIANKYKQKNKKRTLRSSPRLTAADVEDDFPEKRNRFVKYKAVPGETDKSLPFAFPEQIRLTDSILVRANWPLPVSLFREPAPADSNHKKNVLVQAGLQWNVPVTSNEHNYYAKGPDGSNQLYRFLLPGVWISLNKNKQRLLATVNPFFSSPAPEKVYDSIRSFDKQTIKTFGLQAGIQYGYQLNGHWWVCGGVDATWWKKGLVFATNDSMGTFLYPVNLKKEKLVTNFQISTTISTSYQFKACEGFLQLSVPVNKTIKSYPTPIWVQLGVQWRLLNLKCKQK
jgi:hypothetical protein